jgi:hypothetical protein
MMDAVEGDIAMMQEAVNIEGFITATQLLLQEVSE